MFKLYQIDFGKRSPDVVRTFALSEKSLALAERARLMSLRTAGSPLYTLVRSN